MASRERSSGMDRRAPRDHVGAQDRGSAVHPRTRIYDRTFDPLWFILNNAPSPQHGGGCGGDSGSPILSVGTDTIVAVHTGGYRLGYNGVLCGRLTSLNHRIDVLDVLN